MRILGKNTGDDNLGWGQTLRINQLRMQRPEGADRRAFVLAAATSVLRLSDVVLLQNPLLPKSHRRPPGRRQFLP